MTNPPVPATPLDVEACVRLLKRFVWASAMTPVGWSTPGVYLTKEEQALIDALASALPGMGKDSERLDVLESILRNLDAKTEVFLAGLGTTGTARAFQCEVAPATSEGSMAWRSYQGSALRAAIDAAVASTPTEGDPNHE